MIFTNFSAERLAASIDQLGNDELLDNILVPVDFSPCADNAIRHAVAIALRTGAKIKLFHSVQLPLQTAEMVAYPIADLERHAARQLGDKVTEIVTWLDRERFRKLEIGHQVQVGFVSEEIEACAVHDNTDLIVMGTHGVGVIEGMILGSNTLSLMQKVKCPVLIVPENAAFEGFEKIVYATDMQEVNRPAIQTLVHFASHFKSEIIVLHIIAKNGTLSPEQAAAFKDQFQKAAHYAKLSFHIIDAEEDSVANMVDYYMNANKIDALAVLTHQRGFFDKIFHPSLTKRLAVHSQKPLLAFH